MAAVPDRPGAADFYSGAVPENMEGIIKATIQGDLPRLKEMWRYGLHTASSFQNFGRNDTCHPLLHAAHRLHVDIVQFLLDEGLNPRQRGTVHPYTGDCFTVAELQAISPMELCSKMAFMFPRKSKKRDAILAVKELLDAAHAKLKEKEDAARARLEALGQAQSPVAMTGPDALITPANLPVRPAAGAGAAISSAVTEGPVRSCASPMDEDEGARSGRVSRAAAAAAERQYDDRASPVPLASPLVSPVDTSAVSSSVAPLVTPAAAAAKPVQLGLGLPMAVALPQLPQLPQQAQVPLVKPKPSPAPVAAASSAPPGMTGGKPPRGGRGTRLEMDEQPTAASPAESTPAAVNKRRRTVEPRPAVMSPGRTEELSPPSAYLPLLTQALASGAMVPYGLASPAPAPKPFVPRPAGTPQGEAMLEAQMLASVQLAMDASQRLTPQVPGLSGWLLPPAGGPAELFDSSTPVVLARQLHGLGRTLPYVVATVGAPEGSVRLPTSLSAPAPGTEVARLVVAYGVGQSTGHTATVPVPLDFHAYTSMQELQAAATECMNDGTFSRAAEAVAGLRGGLHGLPSFKQSVATASSISGAISPHLITAEEQQDATPEEAVALSYSTHGYPARKTFVGVHPVCAVLALSALTTEASCLAPCPDLLMASARKAARATLQAYLRPGDSSNLAHVTASVHAAVASAVQSDVPVTETELAAVRVGMAPFLANMHATLGSLMLKQNSSVPMLLVVPRASTMGTPLLHAAAGLAGHLHHEHALMLQTQGQTGHALAHQRKIAGLIAADGAAMRPLLAAEASRVWASAVARCLAGRSFRCASGQPFTASLAGVHVVAHHGQPGQGSVPIEYAILRLKLSGQ